MELALCSWTVPLKGPGRASFHEYLSGIFYMEWKGKTDAISFKRQKQNNEIKYLYKIYFTEP